MSRSNFQGRSTIVFLLVIFWGLTWMGCSPTVQQRRAEPFKGEDIGAGKYYFFDDVLVPKELNYKPNNSFIYETPQFRAGSMVFTKWRIETGSLIDFFTYYMEKDNWKLVNSFKGKESILNFSKPDKTCAIKIIEKWTGMTEVEIRVGPLGVKKM